MLLADPAPEHTLLDTTLAMCVTMAPGCLTSFTASRLNVRKGLLVLVLFAS
jgi:hypothetical protein